MSVWLCRQEPVKWPLYIRELDLHVYSSQELSYVIVHNPLLVLEGFVDERLLTFIREQLDMGFLALKMERLRRGGESDDDILVLFLQEAEYCLPAEITAFRQQIHVFKKMPLSLYRKERADYLFRIGQYRKALTVYQQILEMPRDAHLGESFLGVILNNMGACYARLLQYQQAARCYEKSYFYAKDPAILKRVYFLKELDPAISLSESVREQLQGVRQPQWETEFKAVGEQVKSGEELMQLAEVFGRDPLRRLSGAGSVINDWKRKYRRMQSPS